MYHLISGPECLNLRGSGEHTHFWKEEGETFDKSVGGHYHGDTSPEEVSFWLSNL